MIIIDQGTTVPKSRGQKRLAVENRGRVILNQLRCCFFTYNFSGYLPGLGKEGFTVFQAVGIRGQEMDGLSSEQIMGTLLNMGAKFTGNTLGRELDRYMRIQEVQ
jgi:hypothetical protein